MDIHPIELTEIYFYITYILVRDLLAFDALVNYMRGTVVFAHIAALPLIDKVLVISLKFGGGGLRITTTSSVEKYRYFFDRKSPRKLLALMASGRK